MQRYVNIIFNHKITIIKIVLLALLIVTATVTAKPTVTAVFQVVQTTKKKLPIYCVETPAKKIAVSFDAAWGEV